MICARAPFSHRSQQRPPPPPPTSTPLRGRGGERTFKYGTNVVFSIFFFFLWFSGGYKGFSQRSMMECTFLWVQITPTDSGLPRALPYENRLCYLGNGEWLLEKNILSFTLIQCSWRFRALLLNCSFYGYRHLHQKLFQRFSPCISRPTSPLPPPPPACRTSDLSHCSVPRSSEVLGF